MGSTPTAPTLYILYMKQMYFVPNFNLIKLRKIFKELLLTKRMLNFFSGGFRINQLTKIYRVFSGNNAFGKLIAHLECRVDFLLLKTGLCTTGLQLRQLLLHKKIFVNLKCITSSAIRLRKFDIISMSSIFINKHKKALICNLLRTVKYIKYISKKKTMSLKLSITTLFTYLKFPFFLEINFRSSSFILLRRPTEQCLFSTRILSLYNYQQLYFIL